jgi:hypothetical protein
MTDKAEEMSEKHTPGPWLCQAIDVEGPDYGVSIAAANLGGLVGAALPWPTEIDSGDMARVEANARLIAAAPELLEALEELSDRASNFSVSGVYFDEPCMTAERAALEKAYAAIAKATGASQ